MHRDEWGIKEPVEAHSVIWPLQSWFLVEGFAWGVSAKLSYWFVSFYFVMFTCVRRNMRTLEDV